MLGCAVAAALLWVLSRIVPWAGTAAALAAAGSVACLGFFRDPERKIPDDPDLILSPADGRVLEVAPAGEGTRISIFLSVLDVHVNRSPIAGRVGEVVHTPGRFLAAFDTRASDLNEQTRVPIEGRRGAVVVKQIAGLIARRIVCRVGAGAELAAGERFGLIRFGSRTDLMLPRGARATVTAGDRVRGGSSVVAKWENEPPGGDGA